MRQTLFGIFLSASLIFSAAAAAPRKAKQHAARAKRVEAPAAKQLSFDSSAINDRSATEPLGPKNQGSAVLRAQILLARAHYSCGELDGVYGVNLQKVVAAYQRSHNFEPTGRIDQQTWATFAGDKAPVLLPYTISANDVKGPFATVPHDMMQQAELPALGYQNPQEALGEKFHTSPKVLAMLNPGKQLDKAGEQILVPNVIVAPPAGPAARVEVSKSDVSVSAVDAQGNIIAYYSATIGSEHDPLPIGNWKVVGVRSNPEFHYNPELFWDAPADHSKATIKPGPNNPVGVVWISLSKEHYGIHGTPEPSKIGHTESHGCIRLTNWDALELAHLVKAGTPAVFKD